MERIIDSLVKKIGLSSNQLLKCVLLNTAIELFSYIDASDYSSSGFLYHEWSMEDFDHLYSAPPDTGQILESADTWLPSLPSARTADQSGLNQNPSLAEDIACVTLVDEMETMYLPVPENLYVQAGQVNDALGSNNFNNNLSKSESFYYLVGPVNLWLEFPLALDMQVTPAPQSAAAEHFALEDFQFCFEPEFKKESSIPEMSSATKEQEMFKNCGVQTTEEPLDKSENKTLDNSQRESFSASFNHETETKSILWDSYDLHLSRSPLECTHTNIWEPEDQDLCNIEDLLTLVEEEMLLLDQQDVENLVYPVCSVSGETFPHKNTVKPLGEQPVSSTPCVAKTRTKAPKLQSKGKVHILEKLKHRLFD